MSAKIAQYFSRESAYAAQIARIYEKYRKSGRLRDMQQDGATLADIYSARAEYARVLRREICRGSYALGPASLRQARIGDKDRLLYGFSLVDQAVLGVLGEALMHELRPVCSPSVHSYIKGRSPGTALRAFSDYLRAHVAARPDRRAWGLYVLRRDVKSYTDSIPTADDSPLWLEMERALPYLSGEPPWIDRLVRDAIRPWIRADGPAFRNDRGAPTGSSVSPFVCNLYLGSLDRALDSLPGSFYARYGDDFLFATVDPAQAEWAVAAIDRTLADLGLAANPAKRFDLYFTSVGRAIAAQPKFLPSRHVDFLGARATFGGNITLKTERLRELLGDLRARLSNALLDCPEPRRGRVAAEIVNTALDPRSPLAHPAATFIAGTVDDRSFLKDLDYRIARVVLEAVTGFGHVRMFRRYPYRVLREEWGLLSLARRRDRRPAL